MKWITRERPKIDGIAWPSLIRKFVDASAEFSFVSRDEVFEQAKQLDAIPKNIPSAAHSQVGDQCTFDDLVEKHANRGQSSPANSCNSQGADTDRFELGHAGNRVLGYIGWPIRQTLKRPRATRTLRCVVHLGNAC